MEQTSTQLFFKVVKKFESDTNSLLKSYLSSNNKRKRLCSFLDLDDKSKTIETFLDDLKKFWPDIESEKEKILNDLEEVAIITNKISERVEILQFLDSLIRSTKSERIQHSMNAKFGEFTWKKEFDNEFLTLLNEYETEHSKVLKAELKHQISMLLEDGLGSDSLYALASSAHPTTLAACNARRTELRDRLEDLEILIIQFLDLQDSLNKLLKKINECSL